MYKHGHMYVLSNFSNKNSREHSPVRLLNCELQPDFNSDLTPVFFWFLSGSLSFGSPASWLDFKVSPKQLKSRLSSYVSHMEKSQVGDTDIVTINVFLWLEYRPNDFYFVRPIENV